MIKDDFVVEYWNERSTSYSATVCEELNNEDYQAWFAVLENHLSCFSQSDKRALDLGCGPGFFSIILARLGFAVDAVDMSTQMLVRAATNVTNAGVADQILFHEEDAAHLPFPDNSFDAIVMRNVTWLMRDPAAAYAEWHRVLAPGGKLLILDANWYRYLDDETIDQKRLADQQDRSVLTWTEESLATLEQEKRCEQIAASLPFTYIDRPAWDLRTLDQLGFDSAFTDENVWRTVWPEGDKKFYASSPMFMVHAIK